MTLSPVCSPVPQAVSCNSYLHNTTWWSLSLSKTTGSDLRIADIKSSEKLVQEGKWETYRQGPELDADAHSLVSTLQRCDHFRIVTSSCWWGTKPWREKRTPVIWLACLERLGFKSIKLNPFPPPSLSPTHPPRATPEKRIWNYKETMTKKASNSFDLCEFNKLSHWINKTQYLSNRLHHLTFLSLYQIFVSYSWPSLFFLAAASLGWDIKFLLWSNSDILSSLLHRENEDCLWVCVCMMGQVQGKVWKRNNSWIGVVCTGRLKDVQSRIKNCSLWLSLVAMCGNAARWRRMGQV